MNRSTSLAFSFLFLALIFSETSAFTVPKNVVNYIPILLANQQNGAFSANTAILINFNAQKYSQYEAANLINAEFFYSNGTIINSWLEGNIFNEQLATSPTLSSSSSIIYWVNIQGANNFMCGQCSNTIYLGFAGNLVATAAETAANTLMDGQVTGESPLLSQSYGSLDNGANVFSYYCPFGGSLASVASLPASCGSWTNTGIFTGEPTYSIFYSSSAGTFTGISTSTPASLQQSAAPFALESFGYLNPSKEVYGFGLTSSTPAGTSGFEGKSYISIIYTAAASGGNAYFSNGANSLSIFGQTANIITSIAENTTTSANVLVNYTLPNSYAQVAVSTAQSSSYFGYYDTQGSNYPIDIFWARARPSPPSGVMPAEHFGAVGVFSLPHPTPILTIPYTVINAGNPATQTVTANDAITAALTSNTQFSYI